MQEELPLTEAMAAYVRWESRFWGSVGFIFAAAAVLPALFTIAVVAEHRQPDESLLFVWGGFGLLATLVSLMVIVSALRSRQDLATGRFVRWTGSFSTRTVRATRNQAFGVEITAGDRKLSKANILPLAQEGTYSGSVSYLPVSREVLEVRDDRDQLIWSALTKRQKSG